MRKLLIPLVLFPLCALAAEIQPFESDGCSYFPNGTFQENELWLSCCVAHDYAYWKGGTYQEPVAADNELEKCVSALGEPNVARLPLQGITHSRITKGFK